MAAARLPDDTIAEMQRLFYDEDYSKAAVARELNIDVCTVRKYLPVRSDRLTNRQRAEMEAAKKKPAKIVRAQTATGEGFKQKPLKKSMKNPQPSPDIHGKQLLDPETYDDTPFVVDGHGWWWNISDLHFPFHVRSVLELGAKRAKELGIVGIILNGDILDCLGMSSKFHKRLDEHMFQAEIETWESFMEWVRSIFPKIRVIYKRGNHEERYEDYALRVPQWFGVKHFEFTSVMQHEKYGVEDVRDKRVIMLGKLPILHGHEYQSGISAPVNPARGAFLRLSHTVLVGHSHQSSDHNEKNMFDRVVTVWSTGCNCTLKPRWKPFNKWNHGGAFIEVAKDGDFSVFNYRIIEGVLR